MGSKRFKGKLCVYCAARSATTGDHIFAREFFTLESRGNLPQVPACTLCNNEKSKLEHYLATILPFGGRHPDALTNLRENVPRRLTKNGRLAEAIRAGQGYTWHLERNVYRETMTIPVDPSKCTRLFEYVGHGLAWHHWRIYPQQAQIARALFLSDAGTRFFDHEFKLNSASRVEGNLGNGTVAYSGTLARDHPDLVLWRIQFYGGATFGGDLKYAEKVTSEIGVIIGSAGFIKTLPIQNE